MVLSTDPFFIAKELGLEKAAWFAVHIIASDVAVSGIPPKYLAIDLNLPPENGRNGIGEDVGCGASRV